MNQKILKKFQTFIELVPVKRFSQNTRKVFLCYLRYNVDEGLEDFVTDHIKDLNNFFEFLDLIEELDETTR